jgi:hypothetical protein
MKTDPFVACDIIKWLGVAQVATQPPNVAQFSKKYNLMMIGFIGIQI